MYATVSFYLCESLVCWAYKKRIDKLSSPAVKTDPCHFASFKTSYMLEDEKDQKMDFELLGVCYCKSKSYMINHTILSLQNKCKSNDKK